MQLEKKSVVYDYISLSFCILSVLFFIYYASTLFKSGPIWDDYFYIFKTEYESISFLEYFNEYEWPLSQLYWDTIKNSFSESSYVFHILSSALHLLNSLLLIFLLNLLKIKKPIIITSLYLIHPLNVYPVALMVQSKTILSAFFTLISTIAVAKLYQSKILSQKVVFTLISLFTFWVSLNFKYSFILLPILLIFVKQAPGFSKKKPKRDKIFLVLFFLLIAGIKVSGNFFKLSDKRTNAPETQRDYKESSTLLDKTQIPIQSMQFYFFKSIVPSGLAPIYPKESATENLTLVLIMTLILFYIWKTAPPNMRVCIYAYFLLIAPFTGIIKAPFMLQTPVSDQHAYLSLIPVLILLIYQIEQRIKKNQFKFLIYLIFLLSFSYTSINYSKSYKHEIQFYKAGLQSNPSAHFFRLNLAGLYANLNLIQMAEKEISEFEKFSDLNPREKKALQKIKKQISRSELLKEY